MALNLIRESVGSAQAKTGLTQYQTIVTRNKHALVIDEPESSKGTDTGIDPVGLLMSSLASCTSITLRMYIDRKMWIVDEITVNVEMFKINGGTVFERTLHFKGELNDDQKKRLEQIADACPIHKILVGDIMVKTQIV
ncbi:OsmC family protein [Mucilaginibacter jinjuensis]|uniref:OsmC family protein n=1 Tax=Mucilaginibacter jinjuensis TaxID=1176721 RepID=A0ABY7T1L1_9SPHI|nr:OsmC family protein [Mucilaginibacter jinjuensis]WCT10276.1 OsmC family protein [Mucilaginibacter jinjuensis]